MHTMQLPVEVLEQILGRPYLTSAAPGGDRRGTGRTAFAADALAVPFHDKAPGTPFAARLRDLSRTGVGFELDRPMRAGDEFALRLPRAAPAKPLWIYCVVARWQPLGNNTYAVGATFERILEVRSGQRPGAALEPAVAAN